ncbi:MAG: DUF503 domain-containing protein [Myxococcaceae bacterium]
MFVCVARLTLEIPASGSLKAKRQVLRRVTDRVKARFNVSVAEVDDNELWQRATIALAVVSNERRHASEQMEKMIQFVDDMYVAPLIGRETEVLSFGDQLFGGGPREDSGPLQIPTGQRSLAEAEGLGEWEKRHEGKPQPTAKEPREGRSRAQKKLSLEEARVKARSLRNRREWEKE